MADYIHNVMWYTVWDAKTGDLIASGTSAMCARRLGYSNADCFASRVNHYLNNGCRHTKYTIQREYISRNEVDSLPPVRTRGKGKKKQPAGAPTPTGCKGLMDLTVTSTRR